MPTALPPRARRVLQFLFAALMTCALVAIFATASYGHAGHAHVTPGPPAPDSLWPGAPAARDAINQASFQQELAQAPAEVDGACEETAAFDGIGNGCRTEDGMLRVQLAGGGDLITHGPDFVDSASDLNPSTTTPSIVAAVQNATRADVSCVPTTQAHTQLIYAMPADGVDRSASKIPAFRQSVYEASAVMDNTSRMLSPTAGRRLRVACDGSSDATVMTMRLPRRASAVNFSIARTDIEAEYAKLSGLGNATKVRYLVYYDAHLDNFAGIGSSYTDARGNALNNNNSTEAMALQDNSSGNGPGWFILLHELAHNMGAVQDGAPDSNEVSHCNDGLDVMCYAEPGTPGVVGTYTTSTCVELQFDCDHDSYYHPAPGAGWLASNWNVAATYNRYLDAYTAASDTTAPATPTGFAGVGHGSFIRLTWNGVADSDLHAYRIERDTGGGVWRTVGDSWFAATTMDATWTGFAASTSYSLRIRAYDKRGSLSAASLVVPVNSGTASGQTFTVGGPALAAPINAVVTSTTGSSISLAWEAPQTSGATGWEIDKENGAGWGRAQWSSGAGGGTTSFSTNWFGQTLTAGTRYQYRIRLTDDWGRVSPSVTIAGWTKTAVDLTPPGVPGSLVVASSSGTSPTLTWGAVAGATDYVVAVETSAGSGLWTQQAIVTNLTYTVSGLTNATTHSIGVLARDEVGNESARSTVGFVAPTAGDISSPTAPVINNTSFVITHTSIAYAWSASSDNVGVVGYRMLYTPYATAPNDLEAGPTTTTGLNGTITGLKPGTEYLVVVEAYDAAGHTVTSGGFLPRTTADTAAPSQPPTLLATGVTDTSMQLNWGASSDAASGVAGYRVFRTNPGPELLLATTVPGTRTHSLTGLTPNTSYTYAVEAYDFGDNVSARQSLTQSTLPPSDPIPPTTPVTFTQGPGALTETTAPVQWTAGTDNVAVTGYDIYRTAPTASGTPVLSVGAVTSGTIPGLARATSYTFEIAARDAAGNVSTPRRALSFTTPDLTAPTTPGTPVVSSLTATSATLTWTASSDSVGPITYTVARLLPAADFTTTTSSTSHGLTGLTQATSYQYRVTATDGAGNVSGASTVNFSTPDVTPPVAPTSFTTGTITETSAVLNWSGATDNVAVTGFRIYRITAGPTSTLVSSPAAGDLTVTLGTLSPNTTYTYEIAARDAATLESMPRPSVSFTTSDVTAPSTPGTPVATNNDGDGVTLTWTGSTDNAAVTGYRIEQVSPTVVALATIPGVTYDVTGLDDAASYSYRVYARDAIGNEAVSGTRAVNTPDITVPTQPGTITPSGATSSAITLAWGASSDNAAVTGYRVYLGATTAGTLLHSPTGTTQTVGGLQPNTPYTFTVVAHDAAGLVSPLRTITTSTGDSVAPAIPANLRTTTRSGTSITLEWDASSDDVATTGYRVYRDIAGTYTLAATVAGTTTTIGSLANAADYSFKVEAYDAATNTSVRSSAHATFTADTEAPTQPGAITLGTVTGTSIALTWGASTDARAFSYEVRNGSVGGALLAGPTASPSATITGLTDGMTYNLFVIAQDASNNVSPPRTVSVPTPDVTDPTTPTGLVASNEDGDGFDLDWGGSSDNVGVLLYRVYLDGIQVATAGTTSANISGLDDATTFDVDVTAVDAAGNESAADSTPASTTDVTAPNAPATVSTGTITSTSVALSWTAAGDNLGVTAYRVYDAAGGSHLAQVAATSHVVTGLTADADYEFEVTALDAAGNESGRTSRTVHTALGPDVTPPSMPGAVTFDAVAGSSISMSWVASTDDRGGAVTYQVRANTATGAVLANNQSAASATISGLTNGMNHTFAILAIDNAGNASTARVVSQQTVDTAAPAVPVSLRTIDVGATTVDLAWNAPSDNVGVTGYRVRQVGVAGLLASPTGTTYSVIGLDDDTAYTFEVEARDLAGNWSAAASLLVTTDDATAPGVPTSLTAGSRTLVSLTLTWTAPADADVASYRIYLGSSVTPLATTSATIRLMTGLLQSTPYTFEVSAVDEAGNEGSRASLATSTTDPDTIDPGIANITGISNVTTSGARLTWGAATDNSGGLVRYRIERDASGVWTDVSGLIDALLFDLSGLVPGTTTKFRILAIDPSGNQSTSAEISIATNTGPDVTQPGLPGGPVTSTATAAGEVGLVWGAATDNVGVTDYRVSRLTGGGYILQGTSAATAITLIGQPTGVTSTYAIAAVDAAGNISNPLTTTVFVPAPPAPTTPTVTEATPVSGLAATVTSKSISLAWQQTGSGTTGWRVVEIRNNAIVSTRDVTTPSATYGPYAPKTAVRFVVYSLVGSTLSVGATVDASTAADTVKPTKPGKLKATSPAKGALALTWAKSTDDVALKGYEVKLTTKGAKPKVVKLPASALKTKVVKLKAKAAYSVQIRALDTSGNASAWATVSVRTK